MSSSKSRAGYFAKLAAVNVSEHIEKKNGFSYLSWVYAVRQLRLAFPTATWQVCRFDGLPYLATDLGVFVEVAVTVEGITLSQIHPVMDGDNRPLLAPNSFDINTSIQRCLVKAIALHGLGLYIYGGEDLLQTARRDAANDGKPIAVVPPTKPTELGTPVVAKITRGQQTQIHKLAVDVGVSLERVHAYFGVKSLGEIDATNFDRVIRSLENRRSAA